MNLEILDRLQFFIKRKWLERNFSSQAYWEMRYQSHWNSGQGSYGASAQAKGRVLNEILEKIKPNKVVELGCGDGHQLQFYSLPPYLGLDVSKTTILNVIEKFKDDPNKSFMVYDPAAFQLQPEVFQADLTLSVDVIFHLVEDIVFQKYMRDLFSLSQQWVAIYATNTDEPQAVSHLRNRNFTDWVEQNIKGWSLEGTYPVVSESGEKFLDWFLYKKQ